MGPRQPGQGQPFPLAALPAIITGLRARGYSLIIPAGGKPLP